MDPNLMMKFLQMLGMTPGASTADPANNPIQQLIQKLMQGQGQNNVSAGPPSGGFSPTEMIYQILQQLGGAPPYSGGALGGLAGVLGGNPTEQIPRKEPINIGKQSVA